MTTSPSSCLSFRGYPLRPQAQGPLHQGLRWFAERVVVCATAQHCSAACNFRAGCDDHAMKARSTLHRCSHRPLSLSNVPCAGRCLRGVDGERRAGSASALTATGRVPACTSRCADCATVSISCNDRDFLRVAGCELLQVLQPRPCATALGVVPVSLLLQLCAALDGSLQQRLSDARRVTLCATEPSGESPSTLTSDLRSRFFCFKARVTCLVCSSDCHAVCRPCCTYCN